MFEDKHIFGFVCALLCFASIIIPEPIIPIISFIIAIAMFVYKIKLAKESPEGMKSLMLDLVIIIIVIVIDIGFFAMRISIWNEYNKYDYSSSSSQKYSTSDLAQMVISSFKIENSSLFGSEANINTIKSRFKSYLQKELELTDVTMNGNKIICYMGTDQVTFTVTKNDIKYSVKNIDNESFELLSISW